LTIAWDQFQAVQDLSQVSLVKMDIEGAEFFVLPTLLDWLKQKRPALFLSLHAPLLSDADRQSRVAGLLESLQFYRQIRDEHNRPIQKETLVTPDALSRYQTILLHD
jgi:hypothetical protein